MRTAVRTNGAAEPPVPAKGGRKPGQKPDMSGVPGEIVSGDVVAGLESRGLIWGGSRQSPYDSLLEKLAALTATAVDRGDPKPALRFKDARARASVYARAKKRGIRVVFGVDPESQDLLVRIEGRQGDEIRSTRRAKILALLKNGPATALKLVAGMRPEDSNIDAALVGTILAQMLRDGDVVRQEGDTWALNSRRKAS